VLGWFKGFGHPMGQPQAQLIRPDPKTLALKVSGPYKRHVMCAGILRTNEFNISVRSVFFRQTYRTTRWTKPTLSPHFKQFTHVTLSTY